MDVSLKTERTSLSGEIGVTGSKSESNRLLLLQALYPQISISNLSNSEDTQVLQKALRSSEDLIDIHHAGTAMRFLTAYYASREGREVILTGSRRMQQRPVRVLVTALRDLGADIAYEKEEGVPPLRIRGKHLPKREVTVDANISSQYISALMLIAPSLPEGLRIVLRGQVTSVPYIRMTLALLEKCGIQGSFEKGVITVPPTESIKPVNIAVESDWSSASYFYSLAAMGQEAEIRLSSYKQESVQGDSRVAEIYRHFGVATKYEDDRIVLTRTSGKKTRQLSLDLADCPDLAQTIAVTCLGLGISCDLTGLHTLAIKETDRLRALKAEIEKFGGKVQIDSRSLYFRPGGALSQGVSVDTYQDHRMALAFAPLALKVPLMIRESEVVVKSFPGFWEVLSGLGFSVEQSH